MSEQSTLSLGTNYTIYLFGDFPKSRFQDICESLAYVKIQEGDNRYKRLSTYDIVGSWLVKCSHEAQTAMFTGTLNNKQINDLHHDLVRLDVNFVAHTSGETPETTYWHINVFTDSAKQGPETILADAEGNPIDYLSLGHFYCVYGPLQPFRFVDTLT